ncbi:MAG: hypothetical protein ACM3PY_12815 [Omnitrophica WOR_2 bacterium]
MNKKEGQIHSLKAVRRRLTIAILAAGCCLSLGFLGYLVFYLPPAALSAASYPAPAGNPANIARMDFTDEAVITNTPESSRIQAGANPTGKPEALPDSRLDHNPLNLADLLDITPQSTVSYLSGPSTCITRVSGGLVTELRNIFAGLPGPGSNAMQAPAEAQMAAWENLVRLMAAGDIGSACKLIRESHFPYQVWDFTDIPNASEPYWMLVEKQPLTVGWGTYVFRRQGPYSELVVEIPHIEADSYTEMQGIDIFRQGRARALLVAGTHRCANSSYSACTGLTMACGKLEPYRTSDVGHATQTMFQAAHRALVPCGGSRVALQLHGNSLAGCPDAFISNGTLYPHRLSTKLTGSIARRCSSFSVDLADNQPSSGGKPECAFTSGTSVQAVYSNGCSPNSQVDACNAYINQVPEPETFLSVEQSLNLRQDGECLVKAIKDTFPIKDEFNGLEDRGNR